MRRKKWFVSGLALLMAGALAACSSGGEKADPAANAGAEGSKTKLTYWTIDRHDTDFIEQKSKNTRSKIRTSTLK